MQRKLYSAASTVPEGHAGLLRHPTRPRHLAKFFDKVSHATLALAGFLLDRYDTLGERSCHSINEQEVASHSGCYHEYRLGLNGETNAAKHCELPFGGEDAQNLTLSGSYCHKNALVLEGRPYTKKHCRLPARRGGKATQHEIVEIHSDGRSHAEEHCELHNTANHTLYTQVGAQEAIIMESVMLIMEQYQSTTRPAAPRHTAEHQTQHYT